MNSQRWKSKDIIPEKNGIGCTPYQGIVFIKTAIDLADEAELKRMDREFAGKGIPSEINTNRFWVGEGSEAGFQEKARGKKRCQDPVSITGRCSKSVSKSLRPP